MSTIRPDPQRAERNLRNAIRYAPAYVQVYGQDIVDILGELDQARAAALTAVEQDPASPVRMRAAVAGASIRG